MRILRILVCERVEFRLYTNKEMGRPGEELIVERLIMDLECPSCFRKEIISSSI